MEIEIIKETSPHLRRKDTLAMMMANVLIALLPVVIFSFIYYPLETLRNLLIPLVVMTLSEFVFVLIMNRIPYDGEKHTFKEQFKHAIKGYTKNNFIVPSVSAIIFGLIMPVGTTNPAVIYVALITGALFGMIIGKLVFGGTGNNIFNPAAVGMVFSKLCFGGQYLNYYKTGAGLDNIASGPTALSVDYLNVGQGVMSDKFSLLDMFIGNIPGVPGEVCKIAIIIGLAWLIVTRTCDWRIPLAYIGTFVILMAVAGGIVHGGHQEFDVSKFIGYELLSGGLLFGATYMATDPVTSPLTRPDRIIYGMLLGVCTALIRLFAALPEGVVFSILIGNMFTPFIENMKFHSTKYTWKNLGAMAGLLLIGIIPIVWAMCVEVF